jgi:hypothetical protein
LLEARFTNVALFAQRAVTGSRIDALEPLPGGSSHSVRIERVGDDWREAGPPQPLYIVAVASNGMLPVLPAGSSLSDYSLALVAEARAQERKVRDEREAELLAERERLIAEVMDRTREREEAHARAQRANDEAQRAENEARRVTESVSWQALERLRGALARVPALNRALRALAGVAFRGSRRSAGRRG